MHIISGLQRNVLQNIHLDLLTRSKIPGNPSVLPIFIEMTFILCLIFFL
jgi:hypothetical protein